MNCLFPRKTGVELLILLPLQAFINQQFNFLEFCHDGPCGAPSPSNAKRKESRRSGLFKVNGRLIDWKNEMDIESFKGAHRNELVVPGSG